MSGLAMGLASLALLLAGQGTALADDAGEHVPSAEDRYSLANGCFALRSEQNGNYVAKAAGAYGATAGPLDSAEPFRMQATDLGRYLLYDSDEAFMARGPGNAVRASANPSDDADWTVTEDGDSFRLSVAGGDLAVGAGGVLTTAPEGSAGAAGLFGFELTDDCASYPEVQVNVSGPLPPTNSPDAPVRGLVETHMHQMAFEFLGTKAHCGRPWHRFGAPHALVDCDDHKIADGCLAVLENVLWGDVPVRCHNPVGWPTFEDWPHHRSLTHEQSYYKWIERAWRGGLRIFVNLMVENRVLCSIYPYTPPTHSCNEMDSVGLQVQRIHELERYIDAQNGGPGKGWYRIVEDPVEARRVINRGKLAVVKGMEVSEPFDCRLMQPGDMPLCSASQVDVGIDELDELGIRQVELVNKFDNALTGVAGDSGSTGLATNLGNFESAGTFWDLEHCDDPVNHDRSPIALSHNDDELIANGLDAFGDTTGITFPIYGEPPHCNQRGLSDLGERAVRRLMSRGMIFDPDHMSVFARNRALDVIEEEDYPGVMTSHSWSTDNALPRISALGGLIGPAAKSPSGFVADWNHIKSHGYDQLNPYPLGFGYGADMNGFATQGGPPSAQIPYPFQSPIDPAVMIDEQQSGQRTFDFNLDGTAHYGLYADWIKAVRMIGGEEIIEEMANGAEAYLQMWERAEAAADSGAGGGDPGGGDPGGEDSSGAVGRSVGCVKWPRRLKGSGLGKRLELGNDTQAVLAKAGQPRTRRGRVWEWCARRGRRVIAVFDRAGKVWLLLSAAKQHRAAGVKRGAKVARLRHQARPIGRKVWRANKARKGGRHVYKVRKGRVAFTGVASKRLAKKKKTLRRQFALAGL